MELMQTDESFSPSEILHTKQNEYLGKAIMWTALYNILLDWIDSVNRNLHKAEVDFDYN
jgi:hypothetical protein